MKLFASTELVEGTTSPEDRGQRTEDSKQKTRKLIQNQVDEYQQILESIARHAANDIKISKHRKLRAVVPTLLTFQA